MADAKRRKKNLLDDDDIGGAGPGDFGIRVNKEFAARFEHNKRREELHRLQSKYPEEAEKLARKIAREAAKAAGEELPPREDGDSSDDEEEDDGDIPEEVEAKIFDTLLRIRKQDPSIYEKDVQFFNEEGAEEGDDGADGGPGGKAGAKKARPMYLKDMIAKQALEHGPGGDSSDDEDTGRGREDGKKRHPKAYDHEQEALRAAFLEAAVEAVEGEEADGVLRLRSKGQSGGAESDDEDADEDAEQADDPKQKGAKKGSKKGAQFQQLIEAYFGTASELNPDDKFLKEYIVNKGWVDRDDDYVPSYREVVGDDGDDGDDGTGAGSEDVDDEEDERYLRQMDAFEAKYNFRYEEPGADRIITHPRNIEGVVRKPDDKRKRQRDAKKQRLEEAAEAEREEVKRLKNLKKQEIEGKLDKLRHVAGAAAPAATSLDDMLEGDFDPEEWDKKMAAAFNDDYYAAEEDLGDLKDDLDLLGEDMDDSDGDDGDGGEGGVRFRALQRKMKEVDALSEEPEGDDVGAAPSPEAVARQRAELQRLLEEYYKLDYEDNVAGIKTRFRYKEVPASTFGLSVDEILRLDDKSLNQVVGIKRLAPYRDDLSKLRPNYKALEMVKGEIANSKHPRRQYKKREWTKGGSRQGGQRWREKGDGGSDRGAEGETAAAGPGPSSAKADGSTGKEPGAAQQPRDKGRSGEPRQKGQGRVADGGEKAGPGPGSEAEAGGEGRGKKRKQADEPSQAAGHGGAERQGKRQGYKEARPQLDPKQARLASYAVPTLKKEPWVAKASGEGKKRKRDGQAQDAQGGGAEGPADGLSRAQRKNLKRSQKRASKRTELGAATAGEQ
ncbi:hypothetical protein PLESTB_001257000 [Pleodorina starrii]|uniref:Kri1-like C-terminal domain-containing protein n=1 Tax=Pleodorina starrii TaxID=330485 RepID=A0A9W6BSL9_9CHLO|nr:hypothetical protein PLESTM_000202900 [Pleodorina starrii]GLC57716.1 hypothetical protein PLESTB_001257000 [Pleodorina starrii]GLC63386.1 hypothetical protein PLESTF_000030800 [Pleodorina starrii]